MKKGVYVVTTQEYPGDEEIVTVGKYKWAWLAWLSAYWTWLRKFNPRTIVVVGFVPHKERNAQEEDPYRSDRAPRA
jgi:hypothetical protein